MDMTTNPSIDNDTEADKMLRLAAHLSLPLPMPVAKTTPRATRSIPNRKPKARPVHGSYYLRFGK